MGFLILLGSFLSSCPLFDIIAFGGFSPGSAGLFR